MPIETKANGQVIGRVIFFDQNDQIIIELA